MEKITEPFKSDEKKCVFTEGLNYFKTGKESIWGEGEKLTLDFLNKKSFSGKWLNLAAGDGRYNNILLKKADFVVASDIDKSALSKLWHNTSKKQRSKLEIKVFNIINRFPFEDESFDGVFCTGVLHLFPKEFVKKILSEINRVLKPCSEIIFDFATDIK
ncbi:MAG: class I SAM-dependent methyltransferase [Nanoarchaeota archaeon]|nr:class I SAM-dependent methyltransferase [Nanoarchaeota archaeon]MBU1322280.1 class I SAM-dependent methyltransferase [Nanoarchaeota archaeon]MBU1598033.1 class I SAM-dependent methyltransferase [Nanoarchaeota archaeon]MBU2441001.1 class I SAM-dependent methyltransferase [Nanoarchaeota archaeon]